MKQIDSVQIDSNKVLYRGLLEAIHTSTYQGAVAQMVRVLGSIDERAAAAWYVRYHTIFQDAGIGYQHALVLTRGTAHTERALHCIC